MLKNIFHLKKEFSILLDKLETNPQQGILIGNGCYKIRLAIASKGRGKPGGARVITNIVISNAFVIFIQTEEGPARNNGGLMFMNTTCQTTWGNVRYSFNFFSNAWSKATDFLYDKSKDKKIMNSDKIIMLLGRVAFLFFSIWLFFYMLKETKNGYRSGFGNDIKLYVGAVLGIILDVF